MTVGLTVVALSGGGGIKVASIGADPHVALVVQGYFASSAAAGGFVPVAETRILDRTVVPLGPGESVQLNTTSAGGLPQGTTPTGLFLNVTTTSSATVGNDPIFIYPSENARPNFPTARATVGQASTGTTVALGQSKTLTIANGGDSPVGVRLDVTGYFESGQSQAGLFTPTDVALVDPLTGADSIVIDPNDAKDLLVAGAAPDVPLDSQMLSAAAINVGISSSAATGGEIAAWPSDAPEPTDGVLAFDSGDTNSALTFVGLSYGGMVSVSNRSNSPVSISAALVGWFSSGIDGSSGTFEATPTDLADDGGPGKSDSPVIKAGNCSYRQRIDNAHISSSSSARAAQSHGSWLKVGGTCASAKAHVTAFLQAVYCSGGSCRWRTVDVKTADVYPGGGSGKWAVAHEDCGSIRTVGFRSFVDVDLIGQVDPPGYTYSTPVDLGCVPTS